MVGAWIFFLLFLGFSLRLGSGLRERDWDGRGGGESDIYDDDGDETITDVLNYFVRRTMLGRTSTAFLVF